MNPDNDLITYCGSCDLTFCGLSVTWMAGRHHGESECPFCGESLDVEADEELEACRS